jgi:anti-sigma factor RsiW
MTTRECARIEMLLHLHRDGELTPDEAGRVADHVAHCGACRAILQDLRSIDGAIAPFRGYEELPESDPAVVDEILRGIEQEQGTEKEGPDGHSWIDRLLGVARPAFVTAALCAIALFCAQEGRDTLKIRALEEQLGHAGTIVIHEGGGVAHGVKDALRSAAAKDNIPGTTPHQLAAADPMALIGGGLLGLLDTHPGLFDELSRRYPHLASVTLADGIDDREEAVLRSEGAELLKELEKLMKEGERK